MNSLLTLSCLLVLTTPSLCSARLNELKVEILSVPCQKFVENGDFISVFYTGRLYDSKKQFDSNVGGYPIQITVGKGQVIRGWEEGLIGTCEGERRRLLIPSSMGYDSRGYGDLIPPHSDLEFDVEVAHIEKKKKDEF